MRFKKLSITITTFLLTSVLLVLSVYAYTPSCVTSAAMSSSDYSLIYSNFPEDLTSGLSGTLNGNSCYTVEYNIDNAWQYYTCELYHWNRTTSNMKIGVAIKNESGSTQDVYVAPYIGTQTGNTQTARVGTKALLDYFNNNPGTTHYTLTDNEACIIVYNGSLSPGYMINSLVKFYTSSTNMKVRVFATIDPNFYNTTYGAGQVFTSTFPKANGSAATNKATTSGFFKYGKREITIDANALPGSGVKFMDYNNPIMNGSTDCEFEDLTTNGYYNTYPGGGSMTKINGNYGVLYDITINNIGSKKICFVAPPVDPQNPSKILKLVYCPYPETTTTWYELPDLTGGGQYTLTNISTSRIQFVLPGGSCSPWTMKLQ